MSPSNVSRRKRSGGTSTAIDTGTNVVTATFAFSEGIEVSGKNLRAPSKVVAAVALGPADAVSFSAGVDGADAPMELMSFRTQTLPPVPVQCADTRSIRTGAFYAASH